MERQGEVLGKIMFGQNGCPCVGMARLDANNWTQDRVGEVCTAQSSLRNHPSAL